MKKQTIVVIAEGSNEKYREIVASHCAKDHYTIFIPIMDSFDFPVVGVKTLAEADIILFFAENEYELCSMAPVFSKSILEKTICVMEEKLYPPFSKAGFEKYILCEHLEGALQIILEILDNNAVISLNVKDILEFSKGTVGHLYCYEDEHEEILQKLGELAECSKEKNYKDLLYSKGDLSLAMVSDYADELCRYALNREILFGVKYEECPLVSLYLIRFELE